MRSVASLRLGGRAKLTRLFAAAAALAASTSSAGAHAITFNGWGFSEPSSGFTRASGALEGGITVQVVSFPGGPGAIGGDLGAVRAAARVHLEAVSDRVFGAPGSVASQSSTNVSGIQGEPLYLLAFRGAEWFLATSSNGRWVGGADDALAPTVSLDATDLDVVHFGEVQTSDWTGPAGAPDGKPDYLLRLGPITGPPVEPEVPVSDISPAEGAGDAGNTEVATGPLVPSDTVDPSVPPLPPTDPSEPGAGVDEDVTDAGQEEEPETGDEVNDDLTPTPVMVWDTLDEFDAFIWGDDGNPAVFINGPIDATLVPDDLLQVRLDDFDLDFLTRVTLGSDTLNTAFLGYNVLETTADTTTFFANSGVTAFATGPTTPPGTGERAIADSVADFGRFQGNRGWRYGHVAAPAGAAVDYDPEADFTPLRWAGDAWRGVAGSGLWIWQTAEGAHPHGANQGDERWAVRRWVATVTEPENLALTWHVAKIDTACGNGVTGALHINGRRVDSAVVGWADAEGVVRTNHTVIHPGDIVDLVLTPAGTNGRRTDYCDSSATWLRVDRVDGGTREDAVLTGDLGTGGTGTGAGTPPGAVVDYDIFLEREGKVQRLVLEAPRYKGAPAGSLKAEWSRTPDPVSFSAEGIEDLSDRRFFRFGKTLPGDATQLFMRLVVR